jgi:hypothetical protein
MNLYILGGCQKRRYFRPADEERRFERAIVLRLDTNTETSRRVIQYQTSPKAKAHPDSSDLFTSGTLNGRRLYVCTYTEVLIYELSNFSQICCISLPCFNSIHHVCPTRRSSLLVANTGLDMVLEIALDGTVLREWNVLGEKLWSRYSRDIDYRKISTKPHLSHPNFVFELFDEVWTTRFRQKDAICLTRPMQQIRIDVEGPHDGLLHDGLIYFTTVDGHLVIIDSRSLKAVSVVDLKQFHGYPFSGPAWCRGILVINPNLVCVGFTRIRKTALMQAANWIKHGFREVDAPTHVAIFDLVERQCLKAIDLEPRGINILFGILDAGANHSIER